MRPATATRMMAARVALGRFSKSGVKSPKVSRTRPDVMSDASGVRAPAEAFTAVREKPPVTG